uniref:Protein kinase domain-containing protein n=1 Tax=Macrostomum lignano TaxID=282301 RepID=A0A1I8F7E7_9PLAT
MDYVEHRPFVEFYRQLQPDQPSALNGVVHRDVKPSNALYNPATGQFALADFGLAHLVQQQPQRPRPAARPAAVGSAAVFPSNKSAAASCRCASGLRPIRAPRGGTNGYRPPEVLLQADSQDCRVDTWAAGCILAAFLSGRQPFLWCRSDTECLYLLCCLFGLNSMRSAAAAVGRELRVLPVASETLPEAEFPCRRDRLSSVCRLIRGTEAGSSDGPSSSVFDLLSGLLQADPAKRLTAADALKHPVLEFSDRPALSVGVRLGQAGLLFCAGARPPADDAEARFGAPKSRPPRGQRVSLATVFAEAPTPGVSASTAACREPVPREREPQSGPAALRIGGSISHLAAGPAKSLIDFYPIASSRSLQAERYRRHSNCRGSGRDPSQLNRGFDSLSSSGAELTRSGLSRAEAAVAALPNASERRLRATWTDSRRLRERPDAQQAACRSRR